jgi:leucyl aminopeptidase
MDFTVINHPPAHLSTDCLILPVNSQGILTPLGSEINLACQQAISNLIELGDFPGTTGATRLLRAPDSLPARRILLVGTGKKDALDISDFKKVVTEILACLRESAVQSALLHVPDILVQGQDSVGQIRLIIATLMASLYRFDRFKKSREPRPHPLKTFQLSVPEALRESARKAIREGQAIARGVSVARELGNLPGNVCTPSFLAGEAEKLAATDNALQVTTLDEAQMAELGMDSLLSVSRGSRQPARLVVMEYRGTDAHQAPIVLVGKGVTFDTGGISLKPGAEMDEMKFDMCGAASVLGTLQALQILRPALNVVGIIAAAENMPGGSASRPGDVVTSMSGQTIEILNTDAEGRLLLCDALTYAERFNPQAVIDIATLTGACVIALGAHATGLMSNHQPLADNLLAAGEQANDRAWQLPLWEDYQPQLDSNFADMANIGGKKAGTITAACFLSRFTKGYHWAHLDIAGTAWLSGKEKGATGRPVPLLVQYLLNQATTAESGEPAGS